MKCKYCGSELDAREKFCTNCGAINEAYNKPADGFLEKINDSEIISSGNINVTKSSFLRNKGRVFLIGEHFQCQLFGP